MPRAPRLEYRRSEFLRGAALRLSSSGFSFTSHGNLPPRWFCARHVPRATHGSVSSNSLVGMSGCPQYLLGVASYLLAVSATRPQILLRQITLWLYNSESFD